MLSFGICFSSTAQNIELVMQVGDELYDLGDYYGSIGFYEKAMNIDSSNIEVVYKYAKNLTALNKHEASIRYYLKASIMDKENLYPLVNYRLAEAYRYTGKYSKASRYYTRAMRHYIKNRDSYWYKRIKQSKSTLIWAKKHDDKKVAEPNNLGKMVNSDASEFSPIIHEGKIYFTALIADSIGENNRIQDKDYLSRIYVKSLDNTGNAQLLELDEISKSKIGSFHIANPAFNGSTIYFSVCDSNFKCNIWKAELVENMLNNATPLNKNINNPKSNNTQPYYAKIDDQAYLFFSSDRINGIGGMDIWYAKEESFGFDRAINLGTNINTIGNEISPNYHLKSQYLFFSSDWHHGFGGYDIFRSSGKPAKFERSENLGLGINSPREDYYFSPYQGMAVFTSNRTEGNTDAKKGCCNDLYETPYHLEIIEEEKEEVSVEILNKFLPLDLYFHNDEPDPRSRATTTEENYADLAETYLNRREEYLSELTNNLTIDELIEVEDFFESEINAGLNELNEFTPLLLQELQKGSEIELSIRGFASALSKSDYNLNLTNRRIESLINYFKSFEDGVLLPYLNDTSSDEGKLTITKLPFGDYATDNNEKKSTLMAVYGMEAIKQRKIELVAVSNTAENSRLNIDGLAKLHLPNQLIEGGVADKGALIELEVPIQNDGEGKLKLYQVNDKCGCTYSEFPNEIAANATGNIQLTIETSELKTGEHTLELVIVSNNSENLIPFKVKFSVK